MPNNNNYLQKRLAEISPQRCPGMQPFNLPSSKINRTGKKKKQQPKRHAE